MDAEYGLTDERLCWLAVRDQIGAKTRPSIFLRIFGAGRLGVVADMAQDLADDRHQAYAFAVDDAARELGPDDRRILRKHGVVPDSFMARVQELYEVERRRQR
ncbi:hypothetical protein AB0H43_13000 [Hamadaea sp. NPDC050747]|uniref:hypothetical protein n=1 Tax=Hamadaea sp. NPDC050747 TaxID=3155789 RepID=UPI0033E938BD